MKKQPQQREMQTRPLLETQSRKPLSRGRVPGHGGALWAYRTIPLAPIRDVREPRDMLIPGDRILQGFREMSDLTRLGVGNNRQAAKRNYRSFHLELVDIPEPFRPAPGSAVTYLDQQFRGHVVPRRIATLGVQLIPGITKGSLSTMLAAVADSLLESTAPASDYDADFKLVDEAFDRCGLPPITAEEYRYLNSWWNRGRSAATPHIAHADHLHTFRTMQAVRQQTGNSYDDCDAWPPSPAWGGDADRVDVTFAAVEDFDTGFVSIGSDTIRWACDLLDAGARIVSIRGLIEPPRITRQQLERASRKVAQNIAATELYKGAGKAEHLERHQELQRTADNYAVARRDAPPTLVDSTVTVGFEGMIPDVSTIGGNLILSPMTDRQAAAWLDTQLCSSIRANPHQHDLPATLVAYAGIPDLSIVGDTKGKLALIGFTERDNQPAYISSAGAADADTLPIAAILAATGSGKSQLLQWLAWQWSDLGVDQFVLDMKEGSDMSPLFSQLPAEKYREYSMDDVLGNDGGLDPVRIVPDPNTGVSLASSVLRNVNPWESHSARDLAMTPVTNAIMWGVRNGARATGQAIRLAEDAGVVDPALTKPLWQFLDTYVTARTLIGSNPGEASFTGFNGLTYVKVGNATLQLPQTTSFDINDAEPTVRISTTIVRMMIRGSVMALAGRSGVVHLDEAWMAELAAKSELQAVGRLARQKDVLLTIYNQTPSGPLATGLNNYTSRTFNGFIKDEDEAEAGAKFAGITSPDIVERIQAKKGTAPHMGALFRTTPSGATVVDRGAIMYYTDLENRFAPVEVVLPEEFLKKAGTRPEQIRARARAAEAAAAAAEHGAAATVAKPIVTTAAIPPVVPAP